VSKELLLPLSVVSGISLYVCTTIPVQSFIFFNKCNKTLGAETFCHTSVIQTNTEEVKVRGKLCPTFQVYCILFQFYASVEGWRGVKKNYNKVWHFSKS